MPITINRPAPPKKGGAKPKTLDGIIINEHTRLRVGHVMTMLGIKNSMEIYRRLKAGTLPPPDGKMKNHSYWLIDTLRPYLPDGTQYQNPHHAIAEAGVAGGVK